MGKKKESTSRKRKVKVRLEVREEAEYSGWPPHSPPSETGSQTIWGKD